MIINTIEIAGFESSFKAMRLPKRSNNKSDSIKCDYNCETCISFFCDTNKWGHKEYLIGSKDLELAQKLILAGDEHSKFSRGIQVWSEITAPWYFFNELDTYTVGTINLGSTSTMHMECKDYNGKELQIAKGLITGNYEYTRIRTYSYQCLRRIYFQRKSHRLPEWKQFCNWIITLPSAKELIIIEK